MTATKTDDKHLDRFTANLSAAVGGACAIWIGWPFVAVVSALAVWHAYRYIRAGR